MKTILIAITLTFGGCAALHDDVSPQEASRMTTTDLQYIYGSYRYNKHMLPNITNELVARGKL